MLVAQRQDRQLNTYCICIRNTGSPGHFAPEQGAILNRNRVSLSSGKCILVLPLLVLESSLRIAKNLKHAWFLSVTHLSSCHHLDLNGIKWPYLKSADEMKSPLPQPGLAEALQGNTELL